jgi:hypothetical protein
MYSLIQVGRAKPFCALDVAVTFLANPHKIGTGQLGDAR